jgi:hypothetical protein
MSVNVWGLMVVWHSMSFSSGVLYVPKSPSSSLERFQFSRPRTKIVQSELLPEIKFKRSLRPIKSTFHHSGQKRGISVTSDAEMVILPGRSPLLSAMVSNGDVYAKLDRAPRLKARQQKFAQGIRCMHARSIAYHARMRQEIEELKLLLLR